MTGPDRTVRQARREFVRAHHPDRGGDPDVFRLGLSAFDRIGPAARVTAVRRRGPLASLVHDIVRRWQRRHAPPRVR